MSVDPRIGLELEKLNNSCEKINNLEVNLGKWKKLLFIALWRLSTHTLVFFFLWSEDELKRNYQELQETSQEEIGLISGKIKNAIDLAKPFYEARRHVAELMKDLRVDQSDHEKSKTNLAAAKEMVRITWMPFPVRILLRENLISGVPCRTKCNPGKLWSPRDTSAFCLTLFRFFRTLKMAVGLTLRCKRWSAMPPAESTNTRMSAIGKYILLVDLFVHN